MIVSLSALVFRNVEVAFYALLTVVISGKALDYVLYGGDVAKMETYLRQLQQLGAFDRVAGILLGTFSEMEENRYEPDITTLVQRIVGKDLPIALTRDIGHGTDSKAIVIGEEMKI